MRLVTAVVGLAIVAVPLLVTRRIANGSVDELTKEVGFENVPPNPSDVSDDESLYRRDPGVRE